MRIFVDRSQFPTWSRERAEALIPTGRATFRRAARIMSSAAERSVFHPERRISDAMKYRQLGSSDLSVS